MAIKIKEGSKAHKQLAEALKIRLTPYIPHVPHPTQHAFLWLTCLEALYGGSAGGGKSDGLLMAALQYVDIPGYNAILFRKTYADLNLPGSLIPRSHEWLSNTDAKWNENDSRWTFPSGATLSFGYMRNDDDRHRYQSAEFLYCVAKGTGVLMADGSLRAIQDIRVGDKVQTFIGPKAVLAVHPTGVRNLASISGPGGRAVVSVGHPLLTPYGWASPYEMLPTLFGGYGTRSSSSVLRSRAPLPQTVHPLEDLWRTSLLVSQVLGDNPHRVFSSKVDAVLENYGKACGDLSPEVSPPPLGFVPLGLYGLDSLSNDSWQSSGDYGRLHAWLESSGPDSHADYPVFPVYGGPQASAGTRDPASTLLQAESEVPTRAYPRTDGENTFPERSPQGLSSLVHPYTREDLGVASPASHLHVLAPAGVGECWDLTVCGASHYILANGVSSSQCGWDELTHFSKLQYTYMFSRVRRPMDLSDKNPLAKVPPRIRAATNPGGRGHLWVKGRFVKPVGERDDEPYNRKTGEWTPTERVFIPARLRDNPSVDEESYTQALEQLDDATKAQLIEGDWDAREPGDWVIPDPTWIDAAVALGAELWESVDGIPRALDAKGNLKFDVLCIDWGEFTQGYLLQPMPNGGIYVLPSEVVGEHEDAATVSLRMLRNAERMGVKPAVARYDAAGVQSMRVFAKTARSREGWERIKAQKIPFNRYKKETINYLRLLFRRTAAGAKTRVIAIHPENKRLIGQLRGWSRKDEESEDVDKHDDHGPDALVAGVAPTAAAHRAYIEAMIKQAKEKRKQRD